MTGAGEGAATMPEEGGHRVSKVARSTALQIAGRAVNVVISLVTVMVLARALGVASYGTYTFVFGYIALFTAFADPGLSVVAVREMAAQPELSRSIAGAQVAMRLVWSAALAVLAIALAPLFGHGAVVWLVVICSISMLATAVGSVSVVLQNALRMELVVWAYVIQSTLWLGSVVVLAWMHAPVTWYVAGAVGLTAVWAGLLWAFAGRIEWPTLSGFRTIAPMLVRHAIPLGAAGLLVSVYYKLDATLLFAYKGAVASGLYNAAYKFVDQVQFIPAAAAASLLPVVAAGARVDPKGLGGTLGRALEYMLILVAPVVVLGFIMAEGVVTLIYGAKFVDAAPLLRIVVFAMPSIFMGYVTGTSIIALRKQRAYLWIAAVAAGANLIANLVLIPRYGATAAAATTIATEWAVSTSVLVVLSRALPLRFSWSRMAKVAVAVAALAAVAYLCRGLNVLVVAAVGVAVYSALLFALRVVTVGQVRELVRPAKDSAVVVPPGGDEGW